MSKRSKLILFTIIVGAIFLSSRIFVLADNTNPEIDQLNQQITLRKDKIKQLEDTIAKYKDNILQKQTEASSLKNQLNIIQNRVAQAQVSVDLVTQELEKTKLEIDSLNIDIEQKQQVIEREKNMISKIIQSLHADDQKNFLEIMLTNDNFADFYNQAKYLQDVYIDLGRTVRQVRITKEDLDNKKADAEAHKKDYDNYLVELDNKKKDLNDQMATRQTLLAETKNSELKFQTLLDSLRQQYKVTENEVESYESQVRKKLDAQQRFKDIGSGGGDIGWPVTGRYVTARFHDPDYPFRNVFQHSGVDIRMPQGSPVYAASSGYIGRAKHCTVASCYSYILLIQNDSLSTLYGHLSRLMVDQDQYVTKGDLIGYSGGTPGMVGSGPFVTGAHLHFEVRLNGIPVDPLGYLP